jgi:HEAT repeat protein
MSFPFQRGTFSLSKSNESPRQQSTPDLSAKFVNTRNLNSLGLILKSAEGNTTKMSSGSGQQTPSAAAPSSIKADQQSSAASAMEGKDGDFKLVKILISLLSSNDEDIAAIACFDLGEFCRHYPNGRAIAKRLGGKDLAMTLIEHDNPELQRHALQCVSKMMVQNWEYVK